MAGIVSVASSESATAEDVAQAIMLDPALSTKVLRMANSAFYGRLTKAETITQAVVTLGFRAVRTVALAASVVDHIIPEEAFPGMSWRSFWEHCVATGASAELIARRLSTCKRGGESAFVAGLLHDVGKLVVARNAADEFGKIVERAIELDGDFSTAEVEILGTDHATIGGLLAQQWRIPEALATPITHHHTDTPSEKTEDLVKAVRGGNLMSKFIYGGYLTDHKPQITLSDISAASGLDENAVETLGDELRERVGECAEVLSWGTNMPDKKPAKAA